MKKISVGSTNNHMRKQRIGGGRRRRTPPNRRSWSLKDARRHHRRQPRLAPPPEPPVSLMDATATVKAYHASRNHVTTGPRVRRCSSASRASPSLDPGEHCRRRSRASGEPRPRSPPRSPPLARLRNRRRH